MKSGGSDSTELVVSGIECSFSDSRESLPIRITQLDLEKGELWLTQNVPSEESNEWPLRILSSKGTSVTEWMPFNRDVINTVNPGHGLEYTKLWRAEGGGSSALFGSPIRFIAQTPRDGKSFCSMALTTTGSGRGMVRGIYHYTNAIYDCSEILQGAKLYSGWRSSGWQIMVIPIAFLAAHVVQKGTEISALNHQVSNVENIVTQPRRPDEEEDLDFGLLTRKLHECNSELFRLERRAHFESGLVKNIEALMAEAKRNRALTEIVEAPMDLAKTMMEAQSYDLMALPRRIESQRTMIFNLIVQRDARLNLQIGKTNTEIAHTSRRIAEASMRDAASMKTIAVLTLIFLPATTVATFFSMTVFRWNAGPGEPLVSSYIWIYFAVSVPLTLIVLGIWYFMLNVRWRGMRPFSMKLDTSNRFRDSGAQTRGEEAIEYVDSKTA